MDPQKVPLTGNENLHQELQTYPVSRELPNVNTNVPPLLTPQQTVQNQVDPVMSQPTQQQSEGSIVTNLVSSNKILESIQSIAKVMQKQLLFSSKTAEQGIIQNATLF